MAKKKKQTWQDHYTRKAKKDKFPARSVYKLQEIQKKFKLLRPGGRYLDLGCSPGSWLIYAAKEAGQKGEVLGVDLVAVTDGLPANAKAIVADVSEVQELVNATGVGFDAVLSDMAPATTGQKRVDAARSYNLCTAALEVAIKTLKPGGGFVCKIFFGEDFEDFRNAIKSEFKSTKIYKPESSRKHSKEIYLIGLHKR